VGRYLGKKVVRRGGDCFNSLKRNLSIITRHAYPPHGEGAESTEKSLSESARRTASNMESGDPISSYLYLGDSYSLPLEGV